MTTSRAATLFRVVAIAEAISWVGLLVAMYFKHIAEAAHEGGVPVAGPIHGAIFVAYVAVTLLVFRPLRWSRGTLVLALLVSIPPLFTWPFERWAMRTGRLGTLRPTAAASASR